MAVSTTPVSVFINSHCARYSDFSVLSQNVSKKSCRKLFEITAPQLWGGLCRLLIGGYGLRPRKHH